MQGCSQSSAEGNAQGDPDAHAEAARLTLLCHRNSRAFTPLAHLIII
jgi:hypothetical protein